ncbi:hypothetical protein F4779DRAFT_569650 [Xylariaceae sp. FL0662B]|nr:hypothetical protein F4779DRAFT_569650 [Xylariaceae sp. FL0662B]
MSAISRLPESTIRLLRSPLVIITPIAAVKELIDNSIDAKATSIEVIISPDTVSKIEVRDNGVGIHPDDFDSLGRRGHTSKIRSFEELKTHGAKSLGFRGEALASVNSLAQITITTKTSSEPIAAVIDVMPDIGGVSKQLKTSAPVGTAVSVTNFFSRLPVRYQIAVRESAKTLDKLRELLRSYAMARPQLRLSFKVLQSPKHTWLYSPMKDSGVSETALQLFGIELKANCLEKTLELSGPNTANDEDKPSETPRNRSLEGYYAFEAFVVKPDACIDRVQKHQYFSVDGRPVRAKTETMGKLMSTYMRHLTNAFQKHMSTNTPKECFIRLNIKCPPGSYDVNIEPSKDDVLFFDEKIILNGFTDLCKAVYGTIKMDNPTPFTQSQQRSSTSEYEDGSARRVSLSFSHLPQADLKDADIVIPPLAMRSADESPRPQPQKKQVSPTRQCSEIESQEMHQRPSIPMTTAFTPINLQVSPTRSEPKSTEVTPLEDVPSNAGNIQREGDMTTNLSDRVNDQPRKSSQTIQILQDSQEELDSIEDSSMRDLNPWVIAKMNAPGRKPDSENSTQQADSATSIFQPPLTPDPPILRHIGAAPRDLDVPHSQRHLHSQSDTNQLRLAVPGGPYRSPLSSPSGPASREGMGAIPSHRNKKSQRRRDYLPWSPPSSVERTRNHNHHLASPEHRSAANNTKQTTISFGNPKVKPGNVQSQKANEEFNRQYLGDHANQVSPGEDRLQQMFASARHSLNHQLSQHEHQHSQAYSHPHMRQKQPISQLHANNVQMEARPMKDKEPVKTTLSSDDPRAYLLRRQKSMANEERSVGPRKHRRLKSTLLPFENIPSDDQTHSLVQVIAMDVKYLLVSIKQGKQYDRYVTEGTADDEGLAISLTEAREVEERLKSLLPTQSHEGGGGAAELSIELGSVLKGKDIAIGV